MTAATVSGAPVRRRIRVAGVVQGVGFRPFVHRLATELGLAGHVGNDTEGVFIEVEGSPPRVDEFEARLVDGRPSPGPDLQHRRHRGRGPTTNEASGSSRARRQEPMGTFVSPDVAVCDDCLAELFDPADRRYRYPFINCTNCGPRFTITLRLPYDRPNTTMRDFALCGDCAAEYEDPADRRFHAQPVACADCGPRLWFEGADRRRRRDRRRHRRRPGALACGAIVAIKGLGGYHLACDATSSGAVDTLRRARAAPDKPLAVMVADLADGPPLATSTAPRRRCLSGPERPIVLLARRAGVPLADQGSLPATRTSGCCCPTRRCTTCCSAVCPGRTQRSRRRW